MERVKKRRTFKQISQYSRRRVGNSGKWTVALNVSLNNQKTRWDSRKKGQAMVTRGKARGAAILGRTDQAPCRLQVNRACGCYREGPGIFHSVHRTCREPKSHAMGVYYFSTNSVDGPKTGHQTAEVKDVGFGVFEHNVVKRGLGSRRP